MERSKDTALVEQRPFVLKKWNALAMWTWDVECDICAICRVQLMGNLIIHSLQILIDHLLKLF